MKHTSVIKMVLTALLMTVFINSNAQTSASVESTVDEIVKKHEASKGVTCITVIDYSEASEETCVTLRKDLEALSSLMQEFNVSKEEEFSDNNYVRCFASASDDKVLSDFVIALEDDKSKMILHMAGKIIVN